jgi:hypothetical protein
MFTPDPNFFHPGSRFPNPNFFHPESWPKKLFLNSRKYDQGCSSQIWIPDPAHPGSRGQKGTGSRIRIRYTAFDKGLCLKMTPTPKIGKFGIFHILIWQLFQFFCTHRGQLFSGQLAEKSCMKTGNTVHLWRPVVERGRSR